MSSRRARAHRHYAALRKMYARHSRWERCDSHGRAARVCCSCRFAIDDRQKGTPRTIERPSVCRPDRVANRCIGHDECTKSRKDMTDASPRFIRSRQMRDCLRNELLYSEKRPRDILFRAIDQIVAEAALRGEPKIVSRVTREAAAR